MVAGLQCPPPILKFPHSLFSYRPSPPRPHPIPPASSRASPPAPGPTTCHPSPASGLRVLGVGETQVGRIGNRLRPKMLSACDWSMGGAGEKRDAVAPPTHCRLVQSLKAPTGQGPWAGAGTERWRGTGSEGGVEDDRPLASQGFPQHPRITSTQPSELLPSQRGGWSSARPKRTLQLGPALILSKATTQKNWDLQEMWVTICFT